MILAFRQIWLADFILLFDVKENLKDVFNKTLFHFLYPHFCSKLPLLFDEPISGHLYVKDFSGSFPFTALSCGLQLSSITHNFYLLTRNMGITTATNSSFYSINFSLFSLTFIEECIN